MINKVHCGLEPYPPFLLPVYPFRWGTDLSVCFFEIPTMYLYCFWAWVLACALVLSALGAVLKELVREWDRWSRGIPTRAAYIRHLEEQKRRKRLNDARKFARAAARDYGRAQRELDELRD